MLGQGGYRVITAAKRPHVLEQARQHRPDGIILDLGLSGRDSFSLCRAVRADPAISRATPIILTTAGPAWRPQLLDALRAGAWELRSEPLDTQELVLRLRVYRPLYRRRRGAAGARVGGAHRARQGMALACAVFSPSDGATTAAGDRLAMTFKSVGRMSDVIGRTGPAEFTVFAPATDAPAAERLVNRIAESVARALQVKLRTGISATAAASQHTPVSPSDLMARAREALR